MSSASARWAEPRKLGVPLGDERGSTRRPQSRPQVPAERAGCCAGSGGARENWTLTLGSPSRGSRGAGVVFRSRGARGAEALAGAFSWEELGAQRERFCTAAPLPLCVWGGEGGRDEGGREVRPWLQVQSEIKVLSSVKASASRLTAVWVHCL